ncbi:hypothetical protein A3J90_08455 [candidate division WOR-1 bacterium RIFOXYC2_FULL_37_10]|nr:MAG: hypothetical protein A3J90_08455 [candidate division WOR-1 bacterium RIFOXYC2_FULL_37_10]
MGDGSTLGRNLISGNSSYGIFIGTSNSCEVYGNYVGTDLNGAIDLGNALSGLWLHNSYGCLIGNGNTLGINVISGNAGHGIKITKANNNTINKDYIGVAVNGTSSLKNDGGGIYYDIIGSDFAHDNDITNNIIANNGTTESFYGIQLPYGAITYETFSQNSIYNNTGGGIYLASGANDGIASPVILSSSYEAGSGNWVLTGTSRNQAVIEIFSAEATQGKTFLNNFSADLLGNWIAPLSTGITSGSIITLTQTDTLGNTSAFSSTVEVTNDSQGPVVTVEAPTTSSIILGESSTNITFSLSDIAGIKSNSLNVYYTTSESWIEVATSQSTSSPYSWAVPQISTTEARVRITARDNTVNQNLGTGESATFIVDSTAPGAPTLISPSNNTSTNETTPTFTWNALSDISGITSYEISINGSLTTQGATANYTPGSSLSEGTKEWKVRGKNGVGLWGEYSTTYVLTIDATGPSAPVLGTPANGATVSESTPTLTWEASTDVLSSVASYEINLDGGLITQDATTSYTTTTLSEGSHTWKIRAKDSVGNWGSYSSQNSFTVSTGAPTVTVIAPNGGEIWLGGSSQAVTWSASDSGGLAENPITIQYSTDEGNIWINIVSNEANDGTYSWSLPSISTNEARIKVLAEDAIGNIGSDASNSNFIIDSTAPSAPVLATPANGVAVADTTPELTWEASVDNVSGVVSYEITLDNLLATQGAAASYTVPAALSDGLHTWEVRSKNGAGLWSNSSGENIFTVQTIGPSVSSISLTDKITGSGLYSSSSTISLEASGVLGDPAQMRAAEDSGFSLNDTGWITYQNKYEYAFSAGDGAKNIYYKLRDSLLLESESVNSSITVDTTLPTSPVLVTPANGTTITDATPALTWEVSVDAISGVVSYEITLDNLLATQGATASYSPPTLSDGLHTWEVRSKNGAGLWSNSSGENIFTVQTIPSSQPVISIESSGIVIKDGDFISERPTFDIYITDITTLNASSVIIIFDNKQISYTTIVSTPLLLRIAYTPDNVLENESVTLHSIKVRISDSSGNTVSKEILNLKVATDEIKVVGSVASYPTNFSPIKDGESKLTYILNRDAPTSIYMFSSSGTIAFNANFTQGENGGKAGYNEVIFNGRSSITGNLLGNGIYIYKIISGNKVIGKAYIVIYD